MCYRCLRFVQLLPVIFTIWLVCSLGSAPGETLSDFTRLPLETTEADSVEILATGTDDMAVEPEKRLHQILHHENDKTSESMAQNGREDYEINPPDPPEKTHSGIVVNPNKSNKLDACCRDMAGNGKQGISGHLSNGRKTGVLGFEPRLSDSESLVLPLHYTPVTL
jgi:hypothetical protein